ncbi:MAG: potassium transporter [Gammaproteobacteria bacterium]|nr:MAG: potassium transporter [Gammaproteobacteria bacterium]
MHFSVISRILGLLLMLFSISLLPPIIVATIYEEQTQAAFFLAFAITFSIGMMIWLPNSRSQAEMRTRDGFLVTVLFWLTLGFSGALPLSLVDPLNLSLTDAVFESISGLTTTGATVITGLDELPRSVLYYRQQLQWLGGIGIVVIAVAVMPMLGIGGMQLYRTEAAGHVKDNKLTPRITETAKALFLIYLVLTIACALSYWFAGMSAFDAIGHSFSTVAIGGFSTHDASMGYFDSPLISTICIFFMVVAGMNFALHFMAWSRKSPMAYLNDSETKLYLAMLLGGILIACLYLYLTNVYSAGDSIYHGVFQLVSIMTTTGFTTTNFSIWPSFLPFMLLFMSFFGACAGSTGGGIKVGRMMILGKQSLRAIQKLIHPSAVIPLKVGNQIVESRVTDAIWAFFGVYMAAFYGMVLLLLASGLDYVTAWSATTASLNNLGPGLGDVAANYGDINGFAKWVLAGGMLLGRLEIFTLLVLFTPMFWRR